jgi:nickel-dependent lactate racemase
VDVWFDGGFVPLCVPEGNLVLPRRASHVRTSRSVTVDPSPIAERLAHAKRLLVVVNDAYRPTPTALMLDAVAPALTRAESVKLIVATGKHPGPKATEVTALVGRWADENEVAVHDATAMCVDMGMLSDGTRLELNPAVQWADEILLVGSVEPHFFAGFTGGAKQLLPGLASEQAIEANHRYAVHPNCRPCRVEGNPVAVPIRETGKLFAERLLSMQAVTGPEGWEVFCGSERDVFDRSTQRCLETCTIEWPEALDVLIAVVCAPIDRNLYQLQKGFENHQWAVRDGGNLLLVSACAEGVGNAFFGDLAARYPDWQNLPPWESQSYSLGLHKLYRTAHAKERIGLYLYSTLPRDVAAQFYFKPVSDLDCWLKDNIESGTRVGVVYDAAGTVSVVAEQTVN